jgi:hypothetical protein
MSTDNVLTERLLAAAHIKTLSLTLAEVEQQLNETKVKLRVASEALRPFAAADRAVGDDEGPFRLETMTGYREITRDDLRRARAALSNAGEDGQ